MENHFNCIYCYTNKVNGKKYVGQTVNFIKRHKEHIYDAYNENKKICYNMPFHYAIRKYGIENFEIKILIENLPNQEDLNYWECYYIQEFDTLAKNQKGYNLASGGYGNPLAGKTDEEMKEIRRKQSEAMKGKNPYAGKTEEETKETRRKISEAMKETWDNRTDEEMKEIRRKRSEAHKGKFTGKNNPKARKIVSVDPITRLPVFTWQYQKQATDFYGISRATLNYYLKGKAKTDHEYNGFLWYYLDEWQQLNE